MVRCSDVKRRRFAQVYIDWLMEDRQLSYGAKCFLIACIGKYGARRHLRIRDTQTYWAKAFSVDPKQIRLWIAQCKTAGYLVETPTGLGLASRDKITPSTGNDRWVKMPYPQSQDEQGKMPDNLYRENIPAENVTNLEEHRQSYDARLNP